MAGDRTQDARDHDDTDLIEGMIPADGAETSSAGGNLARDVGSKADLKRAIDDPDGDTRVTKQDDIDNNVAYDSDRRGQNG